MKPIYLIAAVWIAGLLAAATTVGPQAAKATPVYAQRTGKNCGFCHTAPPALNENGKKFKANGDKL